jgi:nucleoside-diphosphate-sugar epimerase
MEVVTLRAPLVYGPSVKANFLNLIKIVQQGIPLPLGNINNRRSFIYLGNLIYAIVTCVQHSGTIGPTYLISDGEDVSTTDLIKRIAHALERPARVFPFPSFLLRLAARILGKGTAIDRLLDSLTINMSKIQHELKWKPFYSMEQGLRETARWYKQSMLSLN